MYLKNLELLGFKSFADRTKVEFGKGMTSIVGPNGCGKSNVFDAIAWVLGEQSAKMLRGGKQEDFIFDGTDFKKRMGMAEVSLTLAECEKSLGTEYNEVMVTRRVFRSGEGQYFINKTPCRLKDIQRLFMDTGIGTTSYSLMGQGRIDQILSSRPEDRRDVFEEASGITKYKADRREALRKLEQTEANLLRLADVIREVKRQIISLQRQAGKAARYKKLHEELRRHDIFAARQKLASMDAEMEDSTSRMRELENAVNSMQAEIARLDNEYASLRAQLSECEGAESAARQKETELRAEIDRLRRQIEANRARVEELTRYGERDSSEVLQAEARVAQHKNTMSENAARLAEAEKELAGAEAALAAKTAELAARKSEMEKTRSDLEGLHADTLALESRLTNCQNEILRMEHEESSAVINRERLSMEKKTLQRALETQEKHAEKMGKALAELESQAAAEKNACAGIESGAERLGSESDRTKNALSTAEAELAAANARLEMLTRRMEAKDDFPVGSKLLLDKDNPLGLEKEKLLGILAELIETPPQYRPAVEAVLRGRLDAVVVADPDSAFAVFKLLAGRKAPARLLCARLEAEPGETEQPSVGAARLCDKVSCRSTEAAPLLKRLLSNVFLADSVDEIPHPVPAGAVYVTPSGAMASGWGMFDTAPDSGGAGTLLAQQGALDEFRAAADAAGQKAAALRSELAALTGRQETARIEIAQARPRLDECRRKLAQAQGERQALDREIKQSRDRLDTVEWELQNIKQHDDFIERKSKLAAETDEIKARRSEIRVLIEQSNRGLENGRRAHDEALAAFMDAREKAGACKQRMQHMSEQSAMLAARIKEQEELILDRRERLKTYESETLAIGQSDEEILGIIPALEQEILSSSETARAQRAKKEAAARDIKAMEERIKTLRKSVDERQTLKSDQTVRCTELRIRRQNLLDRVVSEYRIAPDSIQTEQAPEWEAQPDPETLENMVNEMRAKLEAMGPVNLVAIEEHRELEERYEFYNRQVEDLVKAKQQLMDMIRKINKQTAEMFSTTFAAINENFGVLFRKLFGGGTAKLVLADEEDLLECGIEIIASPPGKRLQNMSLLSGGERTLTAVALLFAIYMVKPSPFCVLDELDAALDETNITRFIKILEDFLAQSQFIVITHNPKTISAADVIYGVTMEEAKVSRVVSMRFPPKEEPQQAPPDQAASGAEPVGAAGEGIGAED